jgi:hypothetical protein
MADVREAVLARLEAIVKALPGYALVERNLTLLPDAAALFPAVSIEDGPEDPIDDEDALRLRLAPQPRLMLMAPSIDVYEFATPETQGVVMAGHRRAIVAAVAGDAGLAALVPQDLRAYAGCVPGSALHGKGVVRGLSLRFVFVYFLKYEHLAPEVSS